MTQPSSSSLALSLPLPVDFTFVLSASAAHIHASLLPELQSQPPTYQPQPPTMSAKPSTSVLIHDTSRLFPAHSPSAASSLTCISNLSLSLILTVQSRQILFGLEKKRDPPGPDALSAVSSVSTVGTKSIQLPTAIPLVFWPEDCIWLPEPTLPHN